ncbi:hypothetical protein [Lederbergia graminis]|uniref:Uncharacterized protein n=1 Tax=Lederbergia graminis TaxID=735518 RepID=A0ABW0LJC0_9BACI
MNWISGGGDFRIVFTDVTNSFTAHLREYDGIGNADEFVGEKVRITEDSIVTWSPIDKWVDGGNEEAEFYITTYNASPGQASFYAEGFD